MYQLCPAAFRFDAVGRPLLGGADLAKISGLRSPLTILEVAAGKTYLLHVSVRMGPVVEAIPVRLGTLLEQKLLAELPEIRPAEVVPDSSELTAAADPRSLEEFLEVCRDSAGEAGPLHLDAADGR